MSSKEKQAGKELYQRLRTLSCEQLWNGEVPRFERATPAEREARVAVIRAVGVVFSEAGTPAQKAAARPWLRQLLHDPAEKVRRYAMAALPKLGASADAEAELLRLLKTTTVEREKKFLGQTLEKIGGTATLEELRASAGALSQQTELKVRARVARGESPSVVSLSRVLAECAGLRIHLRGRRGLEQIVRGEVEEYIRARGKFRVENVRSGLVVLAAIAPFSLGDIYALRCFGTVGFVLGEARATDAAAEVEALAGVIASPLARLLMTTFTEGSLRYRLDFAARGHQRGTVRDVANRAYALCPEILNDPRNAPWTISICPAERGNSVELAPNLTPDPRLHFRQQDVPAASHPPLAACMARLAGPLADEVVWDPFCGSGLELIERALLGGVRSIIGTDLSDAAIAASQRNFAAANVPSVPARFVCCDFRHFTQVPGLGPNTVSLVITNPPMGRRVQLPDLRGLMANLLAVAATVLRPGGRLVFANPVTMGNLPRGLKLASSVVVDMNGFDCRLEMYRKVAG